MDPASILGIISFGFSVFEKVDELVRALKGAPEQLRALRESCMIVKVLLQRLNKTSERGSYELLNRSELGLFGQLEERARTCLHGVDAVVQKVMKHTKTDTGEEVIGRWKCFIKRGEFEDMSKNLGSLREALMMILMVTQS